MYIVRAVGLFAVSGKEFYFYRQCTYNVYCVYSAMSKSLKQLPNFIEKRRSKHPSNICQGYRISLQHFTLNSCSTCIK